MAAKRNKIPERMCVSCGQYKEKSALIRIVRDGSGLRTDPGGKAGGRGAYVCPDPVCIEKMCRKKLLGRSLGAGISEESYRQIPEEYQRIHG